MIDVRNTFEFYERDSKLSVADFMSIESDISISRL